MHKPIWSHTIHHHHQLKSRRQKSIRSLHRPSMPPHSFAPSHLRYLPITSPQRPKLKPLPSPVQYPWHGLQIFFLLRQSWHYRLPLPPCPHLRRRCVWVTLPYRRHHDPQPTNHRTKHEDGHKWRNQPIMAYIRKKYRSPVIWLYTVLIYTYVNA